MILAPIEGGAHTLVAGLVQRWRMHGSWVDLVALDHAPTAQASSRARELFGEDVQVVRRGGVLAQRFPLKQTARLRGLRQTVALGKYDVIHAHCMQPNMYSRLAAIGASDYPPVVVTLHSPRGADYGARRARLAERWLIGRTAAVVAVSGETAREFLDMFPRAASRVVVIPNGMPRQTIVKTEFQPRPTRFVALSRIHPQKDIITMIRGFDRFVADVGHSSELAVAGGSADAAYALAVEAEHSRLAAPESIRFLGSRTDVTELLAASDVFVHSAIYEAHSIAILEAAATGLPIVTSDLPTIRESLGATAEYFPAGDAAGLASALHRIVERWPLATRAARELADRIALRYSMDACADAYFAVLTRAARAS